MRCKADNLRLTEDELDRSTANLIVHRPKDALALVAHEVIEGRRVTRVDHGSPWEVSSTTLPAPMGPPPP